MTTAIQWTDETWNPVVGCTKVSQGCKHCYAKTLHDKRHKAALAGKAVHPQYLKPFETVQLMPERLTQPLHWEKPRRCFVNSVSDLFHEDVPDEFLDRVFAVMALARAHTFQVLTKRPARMLDYFEHHVTRHVWAAAASEFSGKRDGTLGTCDAAVCNTEWPLPNVWLGVSVENQEAADERIPPLLQTPAAVRFLSCEPLLGAVDLTRITHWSVDGRTVDVLRRGTWDFNEQFTNHSDMAGDINWVIVGGESGPRARATAVECIRGVVRQCASAGVPCFVKQLGSQAYDPDDVQSNVNDLRDRKGGDPTEWPEDLRVREFPGEVPA